MVRRYCVPQSDLEASANNAETSREHSGIPAPQEKPNVDDYFERHKYHPLPTSMTGCGGVVTLFDWANQVRQEQVNMEVVWEQRVQEQQEQQVREQREQREQEQREEQEEQQQQQQQEREQRE